MASDAQADTSFGELSSPGFRFVRFFDDAPDITRADPDLIGAVSLRARRFCSPFTTASALGWHAYAPIDFSLVWTGSEFFWRYPGIDRWMLCERIYLPGYVDAFQSAAPSGMERNATAFLEIFPEQGAIQVWTGWTASASRGWNYWSCAPINRPHSSVYRTLNAVIEADWWPGPVITVLQFLKTDIPVNFRRHRPMLQLVPLPYLAQKAASASIPEIVPDLASLTDDDWARHDELYVRRNSGEPGDYARQARRRARARNAAGGRET